MGTPVSATNAEYVSAITRTEGAMLKRTLVQIVLARAFLREATRRPRYCTKNRSTACILYPNGYNS